MDLWHPRATAVEPSDGHTGLSCIDVPYRIVLHTTETDAYTPSHGSYYGNPYWPHATIVGPATAAAINARIAQHPSLVMVGDILHLTWDEWRDMLFTGLDLTLGSTVSEAAEVEGPGTIYQHLPIDVGGYALAHEYGPETNRACAVQCEIVWRAANPNWPDGLLATVADWVGWVQEQTGVPTEFAEMWRPGVVVASVDSPIRFGDQEWLDFTGICGHSNVPGGNDHWDPGRLPVDRLRALLDPAPTPPDPTPPDPPKRKKVPDMFLCNHGGGIVLVYGGGDKGWVTMSSFDPQVTNLLEAGVPTIGDVNDYQWEQITGTPVPPIQHAKQWAKLRGVDVPPVAPAG